jgi:hypothetical protein
VAYEKFGEKGANLSQNSRCPQLRIRTGHHSNINALATWPVIQSLTKKNVLHSPISECCQLLLSSRCWQYLSVRNCNICISRRSRRYDGGQEAKCELYDFCGTTGCSTVRGPQINGTRISVELGAAQRSLTDDGSRFGARLLNYRCSESPAFIHLEITVSQVYCGHLQTTRGKKAEIFAHVAYSVNANLKVYVSITL